jgi:predicted phosphodiesterase
VEPVEPSQVPAELRQWLRIGVVGDVHAQHRGLEALLELLTRSGVDGLVCVGDVVGGPGNADACAALLQRFNVMTVRGNHDRWALERSVTLDGDPVSAATSAYLRTLPATVELVVGGGARLLLCHGLGANDMNPITADDYGYALEANDELQALVARGTALIVLKGHRHRGARWRHETLTLVDVGTLLDVTPWCGGVLDIEADTWMPAVNAADGVRFETAEGLRA